MSSYARAYVRITSKKTKGKFPWEHHVVLNGKTKCTAHLVQDKLETVEHLPKDLILKPRPNRLRRLIAGVIYHAPKADRSLIRDHLFQSLALTEARYPNCGFLVTGDFNRLNIDGLLNHFRLKQIVKVPTRKKATPDLILTNMHEYYSPPQVCPPFGLSDHYAVVATPKDGKRNINSKTFAMRRYLRTSNKAALGRYLTQINWHLLFTRVVSCEEKWQVFQDVIHSGLDSIIPAEPVKICTADVRWMNKSLKSHYEEAKGVQRICV